MIRALAYQNWKQSFNLFLNRQGGGLDVSSQHPRWMPCSSYYWLDLRNLPSGSFINMVCFQAIAIFQQISDFWRSALPSEIPYQLALFRWAGILSSSDWTHWDSEDTAYISHGISSGRRARFWNWQMSVLLPQSQISGLCGDVYSKCDYSLQHRGS